MWGRAWDRVLGWLGKPGSLELLLVVVGMPALLFLAMVGHWLFQTFRADVADLIDPLVVRYRAWSVQPAQRGDLAIGLVCMWLLLGLRSSAAAAKPADAKKVEPPVATQKTDELGGRVQEGRFD
jgi:hypothetical protein